MHIYISGQVTGLPPAQVAQKFKDAEMFLVGKGHTTISPTKIVPANVPSWEEAMRICINAITRADAVYALPCWENSRGARLELYIAKQLGLHILYLRPSEAAENEATNPPPDHFTRLSRLLEQVDVARRAGHKHLDRPGPPDPPINRALANMGIQTEQIVGATRIHINYPTTLP